MKTAYRGARAPIHRRTGATLAAGLIAAAVVSLAALASADGTQAGDQPPKPRTTMWGVYTAEQATRGQDTFNSVCLSCHTPAEMSGTNFSKKWVNYPLWDLYDYLSVNMPHDNPGALTPKEYAQVVAYILKINGMPAGKEEAPSDTVALKAIRVDTIPVDTVRKSSKSMRQLPRKR